jgi:CDP-diacylglycerol--serine O-phosphatidyltransferase
MNIRLFTLANILTLINAFCGCCAVVLIVQGYASEAFYFTIVSLVADFFDGFAARKFGGGGSDLGKQLDSLADVISFGIVPATIFYSLLRNYTMGIDENQLVSILLPAGAFILTLFAVLRLAKFNIDTRQGEEFIGLATPAMTLFVIGYLAICNDSTTFLSSIFQNIWSIIFTIIMLSYLMIAEIPMFSFKFKSFALKGNEIRYMFILISIVLLILFHILAFAFIILLYIIISLFQFFTKNKISKTNQS